MKTLYVSDVDGTIYRAGQEELRESSRALFEQILSRGTLLTVASGRNLHGVFDLVQQAGITLPVIAYNGAVIYDFLQGRRWRPFPSRRKMRGASLRCLPGGTYRTRPVSFTGENSGV